ncbi:MAG: hypothetical protein LRY36_02300 [Alphaproteobacteria bacterium]|nr:hypothetical protein [Alphaproteobacteria bacterium]
MVSRFGKYTGKPRKPGLNFKVPFIDKVDARVSTALHKINASLDSKTTDNQFIQLPISIQFMINNTAKYYYETTDPNGQIRDIISAAVRKYTSGKEFQDIYDEREEISEQVISAVSKEIEDYGVVLRRIVIDEPQPDQSVKDAYNAVKSSERKKEAAENEAAAAFIKNVKDAEAAAKRNELIGAGVKAFRMSVAQSYIETRKALIEAGVNEAAADKFMEEAMRLDTMRDVGDKGNLIVMAMDSAGAEQSVIPQVMAALKANSHAVPTAEM